MMDIKDKISNYEKIRRLQMIECCLREINSYVNYSTSAIIEEFDDTETFADTVSAEIINRTKADLELLIKNYMS